MTETAPATRKVGPITSGGGPRWRPGAIRARILGTAETAERDGFPESEPENAPPRLVRYNSPGRVGEALANRIACATFARHKRANGLQNKTSDMVTLFPRGRSQRDKAAAERRS